MKIDKIVIETEVGKRLLDQEIFITQYYGFRHINLSNKKKGYCPICNEEHSLQAHHIIPKRITNRNGLLGELRLKVCDKCHWKIHIENQFIEAFVKLIPEIERMTDNAVNYIPSWNILKELMKEVKNNKND